MSEREPRPRIRNLRMESLVRKLSKEEILDRYFECLESEVEKSDLVDARIALSAIMQKSLHDQQRRQFNADQRKKRIGENGTQS